MRDLILASILAVLLTTIAAKELKSRRRLFPKSNATYSSSEWAEIIQNLQLSKSVPPAKRIVQPSGSGKVVKHGVINKQIIGGENAELGQFPWQVALEVEDTWLCGGSLILTDWVLTAAHCAGQKYRVMIGTISRSPELSSGGIEMISTVSYKHEQYNDYNLRNDIALVKLPEEVTLTDNIQTIALPPASDATKDFVGTFATVSGFGLTTDKGKPSNDLKFVQLTVVTQEECVAYFTSTVVTPSVICTKQESQSTCQGDSGGPLVYKDSSDTWTQLGVVSFGSSISCLDGPSGFTRVAYYLNWMAGKIDGTTTATTTTKKPTTLKTAKPGKCALQNFLTLNERCCKTAPKDLVAFNGVDKSCRPPNPKAFNSYFLNKHQNDEASNAVVYDEKTKSAIGKESVFVNCYLKNKGIISADTGLIDEEKMTSFITSNQEPESEAHTLVTSAFFQCFLMLNGSVPAMKNANKKIDGTATIILQCTHLVINALCTDRATTDKKCAKDFANFDYCSNVYFVNAAVFQKVKERVTRKNALIRASRLDKE